MKTNRSRNSRKNSIHEEAETLEDAVVITGVHKQHEGLDAEYSFISKIHGLKTELACCRSDYCKRKGLDI